VVANIWRDGIFKARNSDLRLIMTTTQIVLGEKRHALIRKNPNEGKIRRDKKCLEARGITFKFKSWFFGLTKHLLRSYQKRALTTGFTQKKKEITTI
jgi:hypothetical protein